MASLTKYAFFLLFLLLGATQLFGQDKPPIKLHSVNAPGKKAVDQEKQNQDRNKRLQDEQMASRYYRAADFEKAALLYGQLFERENRSTYYIYYVYSLIALHEYQTAEKFIKIQQRKTPGEPRYAIDLGYIYGLEGEIKKSERIYKKAIENATNRMQIARLASAFRLRNLNEYAKQVYLKGRELSQEPHTFGYELASLYQSNELYAEMIEELTPLLDDDPTNQQRVEMRMRSVLKQDKDGSAYREMRDALIKESQKSGESSSAMELLIWLALQEKEFELACIWSESLDARFNEQGERLMEIAQISSENGDFIAAERAYTYVTKKGEETPFYIYARIGLLSTKFENATATADIDKEGLELLRDDYLSLLESYGKWEATVPLLRSLAQIDAYYLDLPEESITLLKEVLEIPGVEPIIVAEAKLELADILVFEGDVWDAMLFYMQVDKAYKHGVIGHEAKFRMARLSFYLGEFRWAKSQLDVLKGATSKLIANNAMELSLLIGDNIDADSSAMGLKLYAKADLLASQRKFEKAILVLDSVPMLGLTHSMRDEALFKKGEIYREMGDFERADTLFRKVVELYPYDILADNALLALGALHEERGDDEQAMAFYKQLILDYPSSVFAADARQKFRALRGDDNRDLENSENETKSKSNE